jgi:hypothetical protein
MAKAAAFTQQKVETDIPEGTARKKSAIAEATHVIVKIQ